MDGWFSVSRALLESAGTAYKVGWILDDPFFVPTVSANALDVFDTLYTVEGSLVSPLRTATGRPVSTLPLGADHEAYRPLVGEGTMNDGTLLFIGKSYSAVSYTHLTLPTN